VKIWMLTGDKFTTAVQIGKSCNLLSQTEVDMSAVSRDDNSELPDDIPANLLVIQGNDAATLSSCLHRCSQQATSMQRQNTQFSVIAEGRILALVQQNPRLLDEFAVLAMAAHTVICCRVTPQQKADIVSLVKDRGYLTLAIGDGGNDVAMIQTAAVGVGISGREGLQAARAADFSISQFRFLARLCLVHGRYSFQRTAFVAQYCFYKSLLICMMQIYYQTFTGFSGSTFFSTFALTTYNIVFTSLPVFAFILDRDVPVSACESIPQLYRTTQLGRKLRVMTILGWFGRALFQSAVVFAITIGCFYGSSMDAGGQPIDYASLGTVAYSALIVVNAATQLQASSSMTLPYHVIVWLTPFVYLLLIFLTSETPRSLQFGTAMRLFGDVQFWLVTFVASAFAAGPVFFWHAFRKLAWPTAEDHVRASERQGRGGVFFPMDVSKLSDSDQRSFDGTLDESVNDEQSPLLRLRTGREV
jgi:phospholipid-translocating ATPase